jgi:hypothetical protein
MKVRWRSFAKEFHRELGSYGKNLLRTTVCAYDGPLIVLETGRKVDMPMIYDDETEETALAPARQRKITAMFGRSPSILVVAG